MPLRLDHVARAVPDLAQACDALEAATGIRPVDGGAHPHLGTRNALVTLARPEDLALRPIAPPPYLELIGPDPGHAAPESLGGRFARLDGERLLAWAVATDDLEATAEACRAAGIDVTPPLPTSRRTPAGERLEWTMLGVPGRGGVWPFFIDWHATPHPSASAPCVGALSHFEVRGAGLSASTWPFDAVDGVRASAGHPTMSLVIESARGPIAWESEAPAGFFG